VGKKGLELKRDFMDRNRQFFKAEVAELSFADPAAVATINGWVTRNTAGKIQKIVTGAVSKVFSFQVL
jgi:serine protease inhibitor